MKKIILGVLITLFSLGIVNSQELNNSLRFIEVTGSAEMQIEPDEIRFQIGIEEYWKEEFVKGKEYKDYVNKIPLNEIENNLMNSLSEIGIVRDQIIIKEIGQNWNRSGKKFMKSKTFELVLTDFKRMNKILSDVKVKGVNSMKIAELKNKEITKYREQIKIEAMKAAKRKAAYLLESVDEKLGKVISVIELDNFPNFSWNPRDDFSNTSMSSNRGNENIHNVRKIMLKYQIKIRFGIK
jgi:hypothetical protein